jgi:hypothetical protein
LGARLIGHQSPGVSRSLRACFWLQGLGGVPAIVQACRAYGFRARQPSNRAQPGEQYRLPRGSRTRAGWRWAGAVTFSPVYEGRT